MLHKNYISWSRPPKSGMFVIHQYIYTGVESIWFDLIDNKVGTKQASEIDNIQIDSLYNALNLDIATILFWYSSSLQNEKCFLKYKDNIVS